MSNPSALQERIAMLLSAALHVDVPAADADLFEAGVLDSLAFVELLLLLEREFGVTTAVDDLEIENFSSIARIAAFVGTRAAGASDRHGQLPGVQFPRTA
jgi:methoxymalonate biosynthesis acyl carrier protein